MHKKISIKGARVHNLKNVNVDIPRDKLTVVTGVSGSGKSTLAFDTLYAEGQRRYVESLSSYARQFLGNIDKPDVDAIEGLSPAISIEQKSVSRNPRSTIGTTTEIYDYLRILFARIGKRHCYQCGKAFSQQTAQSIITTLTKNIQQNDWKAVKIIAPLVNQQKGSHRKLFTFLSTQGFATAVVNGEKIFTDSPPELDKNKKHDIAVNIDQFDVDSIDLLPQAVETALKLTQGILHVAYTQNNHEQLALFTTHTACIDCNLSIPTLAPRDFSFNAPNGACKACMGLGVKHSFDPALVIPDEQLKIGEGAIKAIHYTFDYYYLHQLIKNKYIHKLPLHKPLMQWTEQQKHMFFYGDATQSFVPLFSYLEKKYHQGDEKRRAKLELFMRSRLCQACEGKRLQPHILAVTFQNYNIIDLTDLSIATLHQFLQTVTLSPQETAIAERLLKEIKTRVGFLYSVGLGYLSLSRTMGTLSGGESQRIRLATQIGTNLTGVIYVLDEPSIGLHQRDNKKLIQTLQNLRDIGNTVIVVEHDLETIEAADHLIDIGPGAGVHGGEIVAHGTPQQVAQHAGSLTGQYISGKKQIFRQRKAHENNKFITITGAQENNLKNITVQIPQGVLTCVTGVSGSGKSTLINEILAKQLRNTLNRAAEIPGKHISITHSLQSIVVIDQSPIGRTPHSNPATYTQIFTLIRELFANTKEARLRGYKPGRFSFNVKGGRCERCTGDGVIKMEMHFLPDVYIPCEECDGKRYNQETLEVRYKEKNIYDVLHMTVSEAHAFFGDLPGLRRKLQTLIDVGLGYIELGQSALTFSGGEAQRIKLSKELARRSKENSLYILDEPTTGLHFEDINKLLGVLDRLVRSGATVVVIEHNLDVIKNADYIVDLGPEGGDGGGTVVAAGTPQQVAACQASYTGQFLRPLLQDTV